MNTQLNDRNKFIENGTCYCDLCIYESGCELYGKYVNDDGTYYGCGCYNCTFADLCDEGLEIERNAEMDYINDNFDGNDIEVIQYKPSETLLKAFCDINMANRSA